MDWEEQRAGKRILVSEQKGACLDSWNCACTFSFAKAIKAVHFGNRFRFQALRFTSNSPTHKKKLLFSIISTSHHLNHSLMETKFNFAMETE